MDEETLERYHPRNEDDMIDITKLLVGISNNGISNSWAILEKFNELNCYKDILTESEHIIDDDGNVFISRLSSSAENKDHEVRKMKTFTKVKTLREIIEETSKFFSNLELTEFTGEISKLRELHNKILEIYKHIDEGTPLYVSVEDIVDFYPCIINLYTYAYGNPIEPKLSVVCEDIKQRPLYDTIDIHDICMGDIKREDYNAPIILEKTNKGYSYKGKNNKDVKIEIYRDILYDTYYYVLDNGEMYTSTSDLIKRSKSLSEEEKRYLVNVCSLEDAVNLTIERTNPEEEQIDMDIIKWMKSLFDNPSYEKAWIPIIEVRDSEVLLLNCYKKALQSKETLTDPNNIVGDVSTISDIVENMAYTLKK